MSLMLCGHHPSRCQSRQPPRGWIRRAVLGPWCTSLTVASHAPAVTLPRHTGPPGRQASVLPRVWSPWRPRGSVLGLSFVHTRVPGSPPARAQGTSVRVFSSASLRSSRLSSIQLPTSSPPGRPVGIFSSPGPKPNVPVSLDGGHACFFSSPHTPSFTPTEIHNWLFLQNLSRT